MENVINIHPFDVGGILDNLSDDERIVLKISDPERPGQELIEIKGQLYRQTVSVPPSTTEGLKLEAEVFASRPSDPMIGVRAAQGVKY